MQSKVQDIINQLEKHADAQNATNQKAYLKNQFEFLGIKRPELAQISKPVLAQLSTSTIDEIVDLVVNLHSYEYREGMQIGQIILKKWSKKLTIKHILRILELIDINPWWENCDGYLVALKPIIKHNPEIKMQIFEVNKNSKSIWQQRFLLIMQLSLKEAFDEKLYLKILKKNHQNDVFWIQKAIGWSLRDISTTKPDFVLNTIKQFNIIGLAKKEAIRKLND
jgi:3-methyladenine DNA glycosylase AlkD